MNDTERIIAEISGVKAHVTAISDSLMHRMDGMDSRLDVYEQLLRAQIRRTRRQQASIAELEQKVKELSETAAVWHSQDRREVGIDRDIAYREFGELGYTNRDALKLLERSGILRRGGSHLTKAVRKGDRIIRAVVVMDKDFE